MSAQRIGKHPCKQPDHSPGKHLECRPGSLTEIEIRQQRGKRTDQKSGFSAQVQRGNDRQRCNRLQKGNKTPRKAQRSHYGNDHHTPRTGGTLFIAGRKQKQCKYGNCHGNDNMAVPVKYHRTRNRQYRDHQERNSGTDSSTKCSISDQEHERPPFI